MDILLHMNICEKYIFAMFPELDLNISVLYTRLNFFQYCFSALSLAINHFFDLWLIHMHKIHFKNIFPLFFYYTIFIMSLCLLSSLEVQIQKFLCCRASANTILWHIARLPTKMTVKHFCKVTSTCESSYFPSCLPTLAIIWIFTFWSV